jgi:hypothetical protein
MKTLIYLLFLLLAGASVYSQSAPPAYPPLAPAPHLSLLPSHANPLLPANPLFPSPQPPIRILQPDNMPCLLTDLSHLERMPVKRTKNADRIPNAIKIPK